MQTQSDQSLLERFISRLRRDPKFQKDLEAERNEIAATRRRLELDLTEAKNAEYTDAEFLVLKERNLDAQARYVKWRKVYPGLNSSEFQTELWKTSTAMNKRRQDHLERIKQLEAELAALPQDAPIEN